MTVTGKNFSCERLNASSMPKTTCIARQRANGANGEKYPQCQGCETGKENVREYQENYYGKGTEANHPGSRICKQCEKPRPISLFKDTPSGKAVICKYCVDGIDPPPESDANESQTQAFLYVCKRCGTVCLEEKDMGRNRWGIIQICKNCLTSRRMETNLKNKGVTPPVSVEKQAVTEERHVSVAAPIPEPNSIEVDFSDYPELLQQLRVKAKDCFRTLDQQILWIIYESLKGYSET